MVDVSKHFRQYNREDPQAVNDEFKLTEYQYEVLTLIEKLDTMGKRIFDGPVVISGGAVTFDGSDNILIAAFGAVDNDGKIIINDNDNVEIITWLDTGEGVPNYVMVNHSIVDYTPSQRAAEHTSIDWYPVIEEQAVLSLSLSAPAATDLCLGYVTMESGNPIYYSTSRSELYLTWLDFKTLFFEEHNSAGRHSAESMQVIQTLISSIDTFQSKVDITEAQSLERGILETLYKKNKGAIASEGIIGETFRDNTQFSTSRDITARTLLEEFTVTQYSEADNSFSYPAALTSGSKVPEGSILSRMVVGIELDDISYDLTNNCLWGYIGDMICKLKLNKGGLVSKGTWVLNGVTPSGVASDGTTLYIVENGAPDMVYDVSLNSNGIPEDSSGNAISSGGVLPAVSSQSLGGRTIPNKLRFDSVGNAWIGESTTGMYKYDVINFSVSTGNFLFPTEVSGGAQDWGFSVADDDIYIVPINEKVILKYNVSQVFQAQINTTDELVVSDVKSVIHIGSKFYILYGSSTTDLLTLQQDDSWNAGVHVRGKTEVHRTGYRAITRALEGSQKYYMLGDTVLTGVSAAVSLYISDSSLDILTKTINLTGLDAEVGEIVSICIQEDATYQRLLICKQYNSLADTRVYYANLGAIDSTTEGNNLAVTTLITAVSSAFSSITWLDTQELILCYVPGGTSLVTYDNDGTNPTTLNSSVPAVSWIVAMSQDYKVMLVSNSSRYASILDLGRTNSSQYSEAGLTDLGGIPLAEPFRESGSVESITVSTISKDIADEVEYVGGMQFINSNMVYSPIESNKIIGVKQGSRHGSVSDFVNSTITLPDEFIYVWGEDFISIFSTTDRSKSSLYEVITFKYNTVSTILGFHTAGVNDIVDVSYYKNIMVVGLKDGTVRIIDFKNNAAYYLDSSGIDIYNSGLEDRNTGSGYTANSQVTGFVISSGVADVTRVSLFGRMSVTGEEHICFSIVLDDNTGQLFNWSALTQESIDYSNFYDASVDVRDVQLMDNNLMIVAGRNLLVLDHSYPVATKEVYLNNMALQLFEDGDIVKRIKVYPHKDKDNHAAVIVLGVLERAGNDILFLCGSGENSYEQVWAAAALYTIVDFELDHDMVRVVYDDTTNTLFRTCYRESHEGLWSDPTIWDSISPMDDAVSVNYAQNCLFIGYETEGLHIVPKPFMDTSEWYSDLINFGYEVESVVTAYHENSENGMFEEFVNNSDVASVYTNGGSQNWVQQNNPYSDATDADSDSAPSQAEILYDGVTEGYVTVTSAIACTSVAVRVHMPSSNAPVITVSASDTLLGTQSVDIDLSSPGVGAEDKFRLIPCLDGLTEEIRSVVIQIKQADSGVGDQLIFDGVIFVNQVVVLDPVVQISKIDLNVLETWFTLTKNSRKYLTVEQFFTTPEPTGLFQLTASNSSFDIKECKFGPIGSESSLIELSDWSHDTPANGEIIVTRLGSFVIENGISQLIVEGYKMGSDLTARVQFTQPTHGGVYDNFATQRLLDFICQFQEQQS